MTIVDVEKEKEKESQKAGKSKVVNLECLFNMYAKERRTYRSIDRSIDLSMYWSMERSVDVYTDICTQDAF